MDHSAFIKRTPALLGYSLVLALLLSLAACYDDVDSYRLGGHVTGLTASGLTLTNRGGTSLNVASGAADFVFPKPYREGSRYDVTVATQPDNILCTVANGAGTLHGTVTNITVTCAAETHSVGGSVTGLTADGLILQLNGADDLAVSANASSFQFTTPIAAGSSFQVTVLAQPTGLTCTVTNGSASNVNADISNVAVVCSTSAHTISGTISGLTGAGLVLQNNGADDLSVSANATTFQFASSVAYNGAYDVTVLVQPSGQTCSITNGGGTVTANVSNVAVSCADIPVYSITPSAGANGSISPNTAVAVNQGDSVAFIATPNSGYDVDQWFVDGTAVQSGGSIYTLTNVTANHTVSVTFGSTVLSVSVSTLALSVNDTATNAALTGSPRDIVITNSGSTAATNVSLSLPTFPAGTSASTTCGSVLSAGSSCTITVTPGASATSSCGSGTEPTADTISVSADNASTASADVVVLSYGCIYQRGYLFAVDDTTSSAQSIGGKVAATFDQASPYPVGVLWSPDQVTLGISEGATSPCLASYDGACNTTVIVTHYSPASAYPRSSFAAGACTNTISGYSDWYLPAYCEADMCVAGEQSMESNLVARGLASISANTFYWSSTEYSVYALLATFSSGGGRTLGIKNSLRTGVRCVRALN